MENRADKILNYALIAGIAICVVSFSIWGATGKPQPAVQIFATAFWLMFAVLNAHTFYTGRTKVKGGPTFTRDETPLKFYISAISFAVGSMSIATLLLWAAYFDK